MRIGIVSDTHGSVSAWEKAISLFNNVDLIIHAGDVLYHGPRNPLPENYNPQELATLINRSPVPVVIARGNCDAEIDQVLINWPLLAPYAFLQMNDFRLLVTHGHQLTTDEARAEAERFKVQIFISGHTHKLEIRKENRIIFVNPGSPSLPKDSQKRPTIALLEDDGIYLIDLDTGKTLAELLF